MTAQKLAKHAASSSVNVIAPITQLRSRNSSGDRLREAHPKLSIAITLEITKIAPGITFKHNLNFSYFLSFILHIYMQ